MFRIQIPETEIFDDKTQTFSKVKEQELVLEHSLVSISKWESTHCKPFLSKEEKTTLEILDYIRCMTINPNVDIKVYNLITSKQLDQISKYIEHPMTATTFNKKDNTRSNREVVTAEIIYYWMIVFNIPMECEKWHLNRLLTLINVCNIKNQPQRKMTKAELYSQNRALNAARRSKLNTRG